jgi:hypothetical protein
MSAAATMDASLPVDVGAVAAQCVLDRAVSEVAAALRDGLDDVVSDYSYARTRGLLSLAAAVRLSKCICACFHHPLLTPSPAVQVSRAAVTDTHVAALRHLLHGRLEVDVLSVILGVSLSPQTPALARARHDSADDSGTDPGEALRQPDEGEAQAAQLLLRGCCVLDPATRRAAGALGAVDVLLQRALGAPSGSSARRGALDTLASVLFECPDNQVEFNRQRGASLVAGMLRGGAGAGVGGDGPAASEDASAWAFLVNVLCHGVLDTEAARVAESALGVELAARIIRGDETKA